MPRYGTDSTNPVRNQPPRMRTHDETVAAGEYLSFFGRGVNISTADKEAYQKAMGINGFCVFSLVDLFDIIWDFTLDWMHIMERVWDGSLIPLFKGKNRPAVPKPVQITPPTREDPNLPQRQIYTNLYRKTLHAEELKVLNDVCKMCTIYTQCIHNVYPI